MCLAAVPYLSERCYILYTLLVTLLPGLLGGDVALLTALLDGDLALLTALLSGDLELLTGLLGGDLVLVVVEELATKEERELGILFLLLFRHRLEVGSVARHELRQLVDDVLDLCNRQRNTRRQSKHTQRRSLSVAVRCVVQRRAARMRSSTNCYTHTYMTAARPC